jgi:acyl-homoserine lactone acylase PvdQ
MKTLALGVGLILLSGCVSHAARGPTPEDVARWQQEASRVTIIRDDWGIPHVYGKSDADAVFGLMYAQAEDDFNRVETNYINAMGRLAETEGDSAIYRDLRMKMYIDPDSMKALYATSPDWLKGLMDAFADGLNFYLYKHPEVTPRVITHFEPWMALAFSEGSIGGDIERINLQELQDFYSGSPTVVAQRGSPPMVAQADDAPAKREPSGSNGIAIAPSNTKDHHALLVINPHTSFFFRAEVQDVSEDGLDAYGAVTWGQFFVYQGFNTRIGWMHTSSGVDAVDRYLETVVKKGDQYYYRYGGEDRPMIVSHITVPYKTASGTEQKQFTVYRTIHGPIIGRVGDKWVSIRMMQDPQHALIQSYTRTKAKSYAAFKQTMELHTNSSNNTIFADADGDIAYFHGNFIPRRNPKFDWTQPVDGSDTATDWHGLLSVDESPNLLNPASGWLYNSNNWPWSAAGPSSLKRGDYPAYVETGREESPRGVHAVRLLSAKKDFTLPSLMAAAYDSYLPAFARMIPSLLHAYDSTPARDPLKAKLAPQIAVLRKWDYRWAANSVPTSLAVYWGQEVGQHVMAAARRAKISMYDYVVTKTTPQERLAALAAASDTLTNDFGTWNTPWGDINRFQRLNDDINPTFTDSGASIPVPFTSSVWGSLASFGARRYPGTKKMYGTSGNSFVAVVEFGDSVRARAVTAGGESGHPSSKHFDDEALRYSTGNLRDVYYYRSQLAGHTEREYHPGD